MAPSRPHPPVPETDLLVCVLGSDSVPVAPPRLRPMTFIVESVAGSYHMIALPDEPEASINQPPFRNPPLDPRVHAERVTWEDSSTSRVWSFLPPPRRSQCLWAILPQASSLSHSSL